MLCFFFNIIRAFEHLSYFNKGKCVRQQPLALSRWTRPPLSRLVALLARGNTRNTPDTSPFPRWKWVAFFLPFLSFCPFYPSPRCPPAWGGEAGAGPACVGSAVFDAIGRYRDRLITSVRGPTNHSHLARRRRRLFFSNARRR